MPFNTPILLIGFNRPKAMSMVIQALEEIEPTKIYFAVDGPRKDQPEDLKSNTEVRSLVSMLTWNHEIKTLFRNDNLGIGLGPSSAIDWFFQHEEYGIILEDDCVPNKSFFPFCEKLLWKYKDDKRIMHISGSNFQKGWINQPADSYYFSNVALIWGWATWRRAWKHYSYRIPQLDTLYQNGDLKNFFYNRKDCNTQFLKDIKQINNGNDNITWDYQWSLSMFLNSGLSIIPNQNLINNIGFEVIGTHKMDPRLKVPSGDIQFPLKHPKRVFQDRVSDERFFDTYYKRNLKNWARFYLEKILPTSIINILAISSQFLSSKSRS